MFKKNPCGAQFESHLTNTEIIAWLNTHGILRAAILHLLKVVFGNEREGNLKF